MAESPFFRRHQKVVAGIDLEGVPVGTRGVVMYVAGFSWPRCRVRFDNGVERSGLDHRHLITTDEWARREHAEAVAAARAEQERLAEELRSRLVTGEAH
jgi:hypothetical protein